LRGVVETVWQEEFDGIWGGAEGNICWRQQREVMKSDGGKNANLLGENKKARKGVVTESKLNKSSISRKGKHWGSGQKGIMRERTDAIPAKTLRSEKQWKIRRNRRKGEEFQGGAGKEGDLAKTRLTAS